jgi:tetratricopeptide (TPR) repeat protein
MVPLIPGFFQNEGSVVERGEFEVVQNELRQAQQQIEDLRSSLVAQLLESQKCADAIPLLEILIEDRQRQSIDAESRSAGVEAANCSKRLWSYQYQLGKIYLELGNLPKAEEYTRKAYDGQNTIINNEATIPTEMQLCAILRKTGDGAKIAQAGDMYHHRWANLINDELTLECGYQLGCLHYERQEYGTALPLFRRVWKLRRDHDNIVERQKAMSTVEHLLAILILLEQNGSAEREYILEWLWTQHTGPLTGTAMLQHADSLAALYFEEKGQEDKAEPVLASLWAARISDLESPVSLHNNSAETIRGAWFCTGYRYAVVLKVLGGDERCESAKLIFEQLWNSRAHLPNAVSKVVTEVRLAYHYADLLSRLREYEAVVKTAGTVYNKARETTTVTELSGRILSVGAFYAKAQVEQRRPDAACIVYEELFAAWRIKAQQGDRDAVRKAKTIGKDLLEVLKAAGNHSRRCTEVEIQLDQLRRVVPQRPARELSF